MTWSRSTCEAADILADFGQSNVGLGDWCTYRVGGPAAIFVDVQTQADLVVVADVVRRTSVPVLVLGKGSNLLVADSGFDGLVVHLAGAFRDLSVESDVLTAGAGVMLPVAARLSVSSSLTGFEWAVGVPGTVGGAVRMNAGGHGSDIAETLVSATVFDLATGLSSIRECSKLSFGYRESNLSGTDVVVQARFRLHAGDQPSSESTLSDIVKWRRANQPGGHNAGSVFANPKGDSAGRLIDEAGLKGHRIGAAYVSDKHANFIQVDEGGTAEDVFALIRHLQERIVETAGIRLVPENRLIGFDAGATHLISHAHDQAASS